MSWPPDAVVLLAVAVFRHVFEVVATFAGNCGEAVACLV